MYIFLANSGQYFELSFKPILALKNSTIKIKYKLLNKNKFDNKIKNIC